VLDDERQDPFLDDSERAEVPVGPDVIERAPLGFGEERELSRPREAVGKERPREVEAGVVGEDLLDLPVDALRRCEDLRPLVSDCFL
jgi:hypothetical protein